MKQAAQKVVVVTGTSSGLGFEISRHLISEGGYSVIGLSRRPSNLSEKFPNNYNHIFADLLATDEIPEIVGQILEISPTIYGLVNNAASGQDGLLPTFHNSEIENLINLNLMAPILLTKYLVRPMLVARQGRIVNISSIVANTGYRGLSAYAATKAGLEGFTRSLARDLGPREVTVNCVAPGFLETEMTDVLGIDNLTRIKRRSALNRFPTLTEVASAVSYLLSEQAAGITGTTITVDAGNTA